MSGLFWFLLYVIVGMFTAAIILKVLRDRANAKDAEQSKNNRYYRSSSSPSDDEGRKMFAGFSGAFWILFIPCFLIYYAAVTAFGFIYAIVDGKWKGIDWSWGKDDDTVEKDK